MLTTTSSSTSRSEIVMLTAPGSTTWPPRQLSRALAERLAANWSKLLVNGLLLIVAGVLIFTIDWSVSSLSTFIGALFIFEGTWMTFMRGIDEHTNRTNVLTGLLSVAAGVAIIAWPEPGITAVAVFLGAWLIVVGTLSISGAFAARRIIPDWWLLLLIGMLEVPLGVLALANPGDTLAALITVGGIWGVAVGISRVVMAFELRRLPEHVDEWWTRNDKGTRNHDTAARPPAQTAA
jgi:uncharacterized membrane protein HdeD (DUF308 family)